jgi:hypothetical protein
MIEKTKKRGFLDVNVGDIVVIYDEYTHDLEWHEIKVEHIEYDKENATKTNPKGMKAYGKDLTYWNKELQDYDDNNYITVVTEGNFVSIKTGTDRC